MLSSLLEKPQSGGLRIAVVAGDEAGDVLESQGTIMSEKAPPANNKMIVTAPRMAAIGGNWNHCYSKPWRKEEYGDFLVSTDHLLLGFNLDNRIGKQLYKEGNAVDIFFKILDAIEVMRKSQMFMNQEETAEHQEYIDTRVMEVTRFHQGLAAYEVEHRVIDEQSAEVNLIILISNAPTLKDLRDNSTKVGLGMGHRLVKCLKIKTEAYTLNLTAAYGSKGIIHRAILEDKDVKGRCNVVNQGI
ncbi:hypothetical protein LguiB_028433 [Lonicera macranthoides]